MKNDPNLAFWACLIIANVWLASGDSAAFIWRMVLATVSLVAIHFEAIARAWRRFRGDA